MLKPPVCGTSPAPSGAVITPLDHIKNQKEKFSSRKRNTIDFPEEIERGNNVLSQGQADILSVLSGHSH